LLNGFQEGFERLPILGQHPGKAYSLFHLEIAVNDRGGNQYGGFDVKVQVQIDPDWEGENCLDVAAVQDLDQQ
jgi:hypothetical protein